jgi:hypothetical protein
MKLQLKIALVIGVLALTAAPALAHGQPEGVPPAHSNGHEKGNSNGNGPDYTPAKPETPGPKAGLPEKAKAYGRLCSDQSRKHVKGEKGTSFSQCVTAMAKAARNEKLSPGQACKGMSKKLKGEKGTAFSRCVTAAAKLRKEQQV